MTGIASFAFIWIVTEVITMKVYCDEPVSPSPKIFENFRCNNGKYIDSRWFCDNDLKDCGDLSDESFGCNKHYCGSGKFKCYSDGPCIEITSRCNTITECPDGSDEIGCGDETDISNCTLHKGKHLCQDKLKCLDFNYTCDGVCNCFDCSDETDHCKIFDSDSCSTCPLYCLPTPSGPQCVCNSSNYETSKLCKEIENCSGDSFCSQYCTRYNDKTRCSCYENHHEIQDGNGVECRSNVWLENVLIYSTTTKIKLLNIKNNHTEVIQNDVNCTVLTASKDYLYYQTNFDNRERILKTLIRDKKTEMIIELNSPITSLAVDWISRNLYFTSNKSLLVCSNDGRICTQLKCCTVDDIALASKFGRMFFTRYIFGEDEQLIMKSNMDGSEESLLLDMSFFSSISLNVDEWTETVYWLETKLQVLHSVSMNGINHREYSLSEWGFSNSFSIMERHSFFTKKHENTIYGANNINFSDFTIMQRDENTNNIKELFTYNPTLQLTFKIENPCANSSCKGLCLLRLDPFTIGLNYTCTCENFIPTKDNPWCGDRTVRSIGGLQSSAKIEVRMDSSTKPSSAFTKNERLVSTKPSMIFGPTSPPPEMPSCERYFAIGIFSIVSCVTLGFSILTFYLLIRNNYYAKHRQELDLVEQIEL